MRLAWVWGIEVATHSLIRSEEGEIAYVTRRFDRQKKRRIAQEDACQLMGLQTEQKYNASHEQLAKAIRQYSDFPGDDLLRLFELTVVSFLTGNADMHLKNFSLVCSEKGRYRLSPAYDLVPTRLVLGEKLDPEELALSLHGKKSRMKKKDFLAYAVYLGIPDKVIARTLELLGSKLPVVHQWIRRSFLPNDLQLAYAEMIEARWNTLS